MIVHKAKQSYLNNLHIVKITAKYSCHLYKSQLSPGLSLLTHLMSASVFCIV